MNFRPVFRAFVEPSHSSLYSPVAFVCRSSVLLALSSVSQVSGRHRFDLRTLSSLGSHHLPQLSYFLSSTIIGGSRFSRRVVSPAVELTSNFNSIYNPEASLLVSAVPRKIGRSAFSVSAMSLSSSSQAQSEGNHSKPAEEPVKEDVLVQYIVIRKDLVSEQNWPLGSIISQGCHAAVAAIWINKDDPQTVLYCRPENLDHMHKVTLEVKGETQLRNLSQKLEVAGVAHKLWIEQPENYATCLATKPYHKSQVASHFKKLKLCK